MPGTTSADGGMVKVSTAIETSSPGSISGLAMSIVAVCLPPSSAVLSGPFSISCTIARKSLNHSSLSLDDWSVATLTVLADRKLVGTLSQTEFSGSFALSAVDTAVSHMGAKVKVVGDRGQNDVEACEVRAASTGKSTFESTAELTAYSTV